MGARTSTTRISYIQTDIFLNHKISINDLQNTRYFTEF